MIKYILKNYYKNIMLIVFFSVIGAYLSLLLPDILANIITKGIGDLNKDMIYYYGFKLIIISLGVLIFSILSSLFSNKLGAKVAYDLRSKLYKSTLQLDLENMDSYGTSSLIVRSTSDINQIETMVSLLTKTIIYTTILGIVGIIKAFFKGKAIPILTILVIICIIITAICLYLIFVIVVPKYNLLQINLDKINGRFQELLNGLLIIKAQNQEEFEYKKSYKYNENYINLEYFLNKIMSTLAPFVNMILSICSISIIYIMFKYAYSLKEIANMIAFSEYAIQVISSFLSLAMSFIMLPKASASYKRVTEVTEAYNNIYDAINAVNIRNVDKIVLKNVSFTYPNSEEPSLNNLNLTINKGDSIAVIGSTGSGKSTLVNLLNRFYDVSEGEILINDIDIRKIKLNNLHSIISTVFQNEFITRGTLSEVMMHKDKKNIEKALSLTKVDELINKKEISFNGENLSGGQKQRLCIARAILKNPQILLLDDALSAVDYKTEKEIINNLKKEYPNTIKIFITSRISLLKQVDKIIVFDNGNVVGTGTHKDLIKNCNVYKAIYKAATTEESYE